MNPLRLATMLRPAGVFLMILTTACSAQESPQPFHEQARAFVQSFQPKHPPFRDTPAPDAENAAARYLWLFNRSDRRLVELAGWIEYDIAELRIAENDF